MKSACSHVRQCFPVVHVDADLVETVVQNMQGLFCTFMFCSCKCDMFHLYVRHVSLSMLTMLNLYWHLHAPANL